MPVSVAENIKIRARKARAFGVVYIAMLLLALHWALVVYVNSTYLEQYVSNEAIGTLYVIGSALTIIAFFFVSRVLRKLGNYQLTLGLAITELLVLVGLALADSLRVAIPLFVIHQAIVPLILFNLDVFTEHLIGNNETVTGGTRGLVLTIMGIAGAVAPLCAGFLLGDSVSPRFATVYLVSAAFMLLFVYMIIRFFKSFKDPLYTELKVLDSIRSFWIVPDLRFVFLAHFLLQLFFAWMVVYIPLYLATMIGFAWTDIGVILFVGLMAYVLFEYPIGKIADRYIGEKEMMASGFIILTITTSWIAFMETSLIIPWMFVMFMTRIGASLVEATTESFFFKHTKGEDAHVISFFRTTRPLSYVVGALLGSFSLLYLPFNYIFIVLGLMMVPGIIFALMLDDTK